MATIKVDNATVKNVHVRVVPDDVQHTDVLIGRTFTDAGSIVYVKEGNSLTFKETEGSDERVESPPVADFKVVKDNIIPPMSVHIIDVAASDDSLSLPVLNSSSEQRELKEGEVLETASSETIPMLPERIFHAPITCEDINVGENVPVNVVSDLVSVLNDYRDCIALNLAELGRVKSAALEIVEKAGSVPVHYKPYRASNAERDSIRRIVSEWRAAGIVGDTDSPYASPVLLVRKKNGEERLVIDFRKLNAQTVPMPFPLPDIDDHLMEIKDNNLFITLDLAHGYLQIPIAENSRHKTAFITPDETAECNSMMFGLMNAPACFSKIMSKYIGPLRKYAILFYLDDIFIK